MVHKWERWFRKDHDSVDDEIAANVERARQVVDGSEHPFVIEILEWLDKESNSPFKIGDHTTMVVTATRANTMRELRSHILSRIEFARRVVEASREGSDV